MTAPFLPVRADGRSDRQVIVDLVTGSEPGDTVTYRQILDALAAGLTVSPDRDRAYRAVAAANRTLLRERSRYLRVVRNTGYRMISADEHLPEAITKKDRAQTYLRRGVELLRNTRLDELDDNQRALHLGQLNILAAHDESLRSQQRRQDRHEAVIAGLAARVGRLEAGE
jgi:hypothetical protein